MSRRKPDIEATEPTISSSGSSKSDFNTAQHHEHTVVQHRQASVAAKLRNPLAGLSEQQVLADVEAWCTEKGLQSELEAFRKGALIARIGQREDGFEYVDALSTEEKDVLRHEINHRWSQPFMLYFLVVLCAGSAIVQGMDQTAVNGAQVSPSFFYSRSFGADGFLQEFYFEEFNIGEDQVWLRGLLNGAPYLCSALIGCWSNAPLNKYFGRRGTIFISCIISFITGIWMAACESCKSHPSKHASSAY